MKLQKAMFISVAAIALAVTGCKKKTDEVPAAGTATGTAAGTTVASGTGTGTGTAAPAAPDAAEAPAADADYLKLVADHIEAGKGTVDVVFATPTVTKASFDPANLEGGTAELDVDVNSLSSGIDKRDGHLKNPDYLDVVKFPKATVKIANVKKTGEGAYTADATFAIHGIEKTWSLPFTVVSSTADSVRVKFEQKFNRLDFGIGKPESDDTVKQDVVLHGLVTIKKT